MPLAVLIDDPASVENWELAEADMRRFWSQRCKVYRQPGRVVIEVGSPVRIRAKMGVDRLKSFCVKARVANVQHLIRTI